MRPSLRPNASFFLACVGRWLAIAMLMHVTPARAQFDELIRGVIGQALQQGGVQYRIPNHPRAPYILERRSPHEAASRGTRPVSGPSYDCSRANGQTSVTICGDESLSVLDSRMATGFTNVSNARILTDLPRSQHDWLLKRNSCLSDRACIRQAYEERIAFLEGLIAPGKGTQTVVAGQPAVTKVAPGDPLRMLVYPSPGLAPWHFDSIDQRLAVTYLNQVLPGSKERDMETARRFFVLLAIDADPSTIDGLRNNPSFLSTFVSDETSAAFMTSNHVAWLGNNPLTQERNSNAFIVDLKRRLRGAAPKLPMRLTWVEMARAGAFDDANGGFHIKTNAYSAFGSTKPAISLQEVVKSAGLKVNSDLAVPTLFWPMSRDSAESFLTSDPAGEVEIKLTVDILGLDSSTGELATKLLGAAVYNKHHTRLLHDFRIDPVSTTSDPSQTDAKRLRDQVQRGGTTASGDSWQLPHQGGSPVVTPLEFDSAATLVPFAAGDGLTGNSPRHSPRERWARFLDALALRIDTEEGSTLSDGDAAHLACVFLPSMEHTRMFGQSACDFRTYIPGAEFSIKDGGSAFRQSTARQIIAGGPKLPVKMNVVIPIGVGQYERGHLGLKSSLPVNGGPISIFGSSLDVLLPQGWPISESDARAFTALQQSSYGSRGWLVVETTLVGTTPPSTPRGMFEGGTALADRRVWRFQTSAMTLFADEALKKPLFAFPLDGFKLSQPGADMASQGEDRPAAPIRMSGELGLLALLSKANTDDVVIRWQQAADARYRFESAFAAKPDWKSFDPWGRFFPAMPDAAGVERYHAWTVRRAANLPDQVSFWRLLSPYVASRRPSQISAFGSDNYVVSGFNGYDESRSSLDEDLTRRLRARGVEPAQLAPLRIPMPGSDDVLVLAAFPVPAEQYVLDLALASPKLADGGQQPRYEVRAQLFGIEVVRYGTGGRKIAVVVKLRPEGATFWQDGADVGAVQFSPTQWAPRPEAPPPAADRLAGPPYGYEMVGVRLGMTMADAEGAVRSHMTVSREVEGRQAQLNMQSIGPQHGKLFVDETSGEMIALYDWPPAAAGRVVAVWRTMPIPRDQWDSILTQTLAGKFGEPTVRGDHEAFWTVRPSSEGTTGNCLLGSGQDGGVDWRTDGKPFQFSSNAGERPEIPRLQQGAKAVYTGCGPVFHVRNPQLMGGGRVPLESVLFDLDVLSHITQGLLAASPPSDPEMPAIKF